MGSAGKILRERNEENGCPRSDTARIMVTRRKDGVIDVNAHTDPTAQIITALQ